MRVEAVNLRAVNVVIMMVTIKNNHGKDEMLRSYFARSLGFFARCFGTRS